MKEENNVRCIVVSAFAFVKVAIFSLEGIILMRMVVTMEKMVLKTSSQWIVFPLHKNANQRNMSFPICIFA